METDCMELFKFVMQNVPLMRIQGHVSKVTIEYWSEDGDSIPYSFVTKWLKKIWQANATTGCH